jgi:hypothetical protein
VRVQLGAVVAVKGAIFFLSGCECYYVCLSTFAHNCALTGVTGENKKGK